MDPVPESTLKTRRADSSRIWKTSRPLDAELQSVYNMTIQVTDGTRVATAQVCIRVLDTNDNPPVFSQPAYDLVVSEVAAPGTALLRLRALDADERSRLSFSLQAAVDPASVRLFRVHAATGTLYTAGPLDYETRTQHILTVMVKDQEAPFHRDLARVLVAVEDSNDNAPSFSAASYHGTVVSGSTPAGTAVLQVTAFDPDSGVNGQLTYSIEAGNADGRFAIGNSSGVIYAAGSSDAATAWGSYLLTVRVTDAGEPPLTATASAHIVVMPPDVSTATFAQREYQAEVMENSTVGSLVAVVGATSRTPLVYDLTGGDEEGSFLVNPYSGAVTLRTTLDSEQTASYSLEVRALSAVGQEARTRLLVQVGDVNDNPPVLQGLRYAAAADSPPS
ncbi:hypothetical protein CRUP_000130 [Coryphaenoides rupestris]|nr:hypothetical protein CRUP_000130 [Coryphaenoides rupestris]